MSQQDARDMSALRCPAHSAAVGQARGGGACLLALQLPTSQAGCWLNADPWQPQQRGRSSLLAFERRLLSGAGPACLDMRPPKSQQGGWPHAAPQRHGSLTTCWLVRSCFCLL